jgi:hypothetical protein
MGQVLEQRLNRCGEREIRKSEARGNFGLRRGLLRRAKAGQSLTSAFGKVSLTIPGHGPITTHKLRARIPLEKIKE